MHMYVMCVDMHSEKFRFLPVFLKKYTTCSTVHGILPVDMPRRPHTCTLAFALLATVC